MKNVKNGMKKEMIAVLIAVILASVPTLARAQTPSARASETQLRTDIMIDVQQEGKGGNRM